MDKGTKRSPGDKAEVDRLRSLVLDMGRSIRALDENHQHLEYWTQDGDYVIESRWEK